MSKHYTLADFDFELPTSLIAQAPCENRVESRLLVALNDEIQDKKFLDIIDFFEAGDVLVLNDTKVIPARLKGEKDTGGKLEIFVERINAETTAFCMIKASKAPHIGAKIYIHLNDNEKLAAKLLAKHGRFYDIVLLESSWQTVLEIAGDIPLPPYIERQTDKDDLERYQTVYAKHPGAVAAPTAGLHFNHDIFHALKMKGVEMCYVTLHVGAGTFLPVKTDDLDQHEMHSELFSIDEQAIATILSAKAEGRRVTAVGTTSLRALESAYVSAIKSFNIGWQETALFIRPGFEFQVVDRLLTNFHLPKSTLMMLVSAFAGYEATKNIYQHAIAESYRFFSYGDAMLLSKQG